MKNSLTDLAKTLNSNLGMESCVAYRVLSERGKRIYFPHKGILGQSAEAKTAEINATIGTAFEDDGAPLMLPVVKKAFAMPEKNRANGIPLPAQFWQTAAPQKMGRKNAAKKSQLGRR